MDPLSPDILILGAGILGSVTAWHLARHSAGSITVIDVDLAGTFSSTERNAGGCRATWWHPLNAELSWRSIQFYEGIAEDIQFFQRGYLFLYPRRGWEIALQKRKQYEGLGIPVEYLKPEDLREKLPEFENLKGVAGATFSPRDGLVDPHLLREYYREGARRLGVQFLDRRYATGAKTRGHRLESLRVLRHRGKSSIEEASLERIQTLHRIEHATEWEEEVFRAKIFLNCSGAWLPISSRLYARESPVRAVRRQISLFSSHEEDFSDRGMIVDSSGLYLHAEGRNSGLILAGYSNRDEKPGYSFRYDGEKFFDRKIWLRLYRRGNRRHFEAIHHLRGWAGLYAVSPDKTAILGRVPGFENLYELGAATGRGIMQSYALGLLMSELIVQGRFETLDASSLAGDRFAQGRFQQESLDI